MDGHMLCTYYTTIHNRQTSRWECHAALTRLLYITLACQTLSSDLGLIARLGSQTLAHKRRLAYEMQSFSPLSKATYHTWHGKSDLIKRAVTLI